jgi:hypothetical protein
MNSFDLKQIKNDLVQIQQILTPSSCLLSRLIRKPVYKIRKNNNIEQNNVENRKEIRKFIMVDYDSNISINNLLRKQDAFEFRLKLIEDEVRTENVESDCLLDIILKNMKSSPYGNVSSILKQ